MLKLFKITETGIGILVQGNIAIIEHNLAATTNGKKWEIPAMCIYEFKDEKIQKLRSFYDVLAQAKQVVGGRYCQNSRKFCSESFSKRVTLVSTNYG